MNRIEMLEEEADRRRADFARSLSQVKRKLTPMGLADEALRRLDPHGEALVNTGKSLARNPLPAIPVLLGLSWLALNARKKEKARPARARAKVNGRRKPKSLAATSRKEDTDENA